MKHLLIIFAFLTMVGTINARPTNDDAAAQTAAQTESPVDPAAEAQNTEVQNPDVAADESATEDQLERMWDAAGTAYVNNDYHQAIAIYESLIAEGWISSRLYYNLANAYFKEGQIGRAILYYRRALRLDPSDSDARYNLSVAEARTKDHIEAIPEFFLSEWFRGLRRTLSGTTWSVLSLVSLAAGCVLFLFYLLARQLSRRKIGFYGTLVAVLLFVSTTLFAVGDRQTQLDHSEAVVMAGATAVKSAPDLSATDLFVLHEGTAVHVTERMERWCEVIIADGKKGWIEVSKIEEI